MNIFRHHRRCSGACCIVNVLLLDVCIREICAVLVLVDLCSPVIMVVMLLTSHILQLDKLVVAEGNFWWDHDECPAPKPYMHPAACCSQCCHREQ